MNKNIFAFDLLALYKIDLVFLMQKKVLKQFTNKSSNLNLFSKKLNKLCKNLKLKKVLIKYEKEINKIIFNNCVLQIIYFPNTQLLNYMIRKLKMNEFFISNIHFYFETSCLVWFN